MIPLKYLLILTLLISCVDKNMDQENIIDANPYLIGKWTGEGNFLDVKLNYEIGKVIIEMEIKEDHTIVGRIGDAKLVDTNIRKANFGFTIRGKLDSKFKKDSDLEKDHLIILLVLPEKDREKSTTSSANFHLKSNYIYDSSMRVGGVLLTKTP
ncbi:MAG: hypothetical protein OEM04_09525 [Flavobacteriaceae bacterium]|nr:hypothetical protein [Flavobacteriaceae bacterium]